MARGGGGAPAPDPRPVERAIEARPQDDGLGSVVRCLHIASTFLVSCKSPSVYTYDEHAFMVDYFISMRLPMKTEPSVKSSSGPIARQSTNLMQILETNLNTLFTHPTEIHPGARWMP